ncbi:MAG: gluconokinase, GntK/IdnK-type [Planctomycetota bacterium]
MKRSSIPHIILMGVAGSGKTTLGVALAQRLDRHFVDADDHHPPANRLKMAAGRALSDADRQPWLDTLANLLASSPPLILACSALRHAYRQHLSAHCTNPPRFIWLDVPEPILQQRLEQREANSQHFMPASQLRNQLDTLEAPHANEHILRIPADQPVDAIVNEVCSALTGSA